MYSGIYNLNATFYTMETLSTTGQNIVAPDSTPTWSIYSSQGTLLLTGTMIAIIGKTGLYYFSTPIQDSAGFSANSQYTVTIEYAVSGTQYRKLQTFTAT